jgi:hypothetical protein
MSRRPSSGRKPGPPRRRHHTTDPPCPAVSTSDPPGPGISTSDPPRPGVSASGPPRLSAGRATSSPGRAAVVLGAPAAEPPIALPRRTVLGGQDQHDQETDDREQHAEPQAELLSVALAVDHPGRAPLRREATRNRRQSALAPISARIVIRFPGRPAGLPGRCAAGRSRRPARCDRFPGRSRGARRRARSWRSARRAGSRLQGLPSRIPRVPDDHGRLRPVVGQDLHEHRREPEDRVRGHAGRGRDRLGEREESPVGEAVAVDQESSSGASVDATYGRLSRGVATTPSAQYSLTVPGR